MVKNYLSKLKLGFEISDNLKTFIKLIINSKKYSSAFKNNLIKENTTFSIDETYDFTINAKKQEITMRTYLGDIDIFYEIFSKKFTKYRKNSLAILM